MTRIAIDLSRREIRLAAETEKGTAELTLALSREGSTRIAPALTRLLELLSTEPAEIREIIVVRGPGSFTGLRVGFAFAAGIARATGATVRSIPLPEAIALAHAADLPLAKIRTFGVALAAGRNEAYTAIVRLVDGRPEGDTAAVAITPCAALPALFAGVDQIVLDPGLPHSEEITYRFMHLPPRSLFSAAQILTEYSGVQPLTPLYVRKSAAREKREAAAC